MTENNDKWITVDKRTQKLVIRFRMRGLDKQCFISTGLDDTKKNRATVADKRDAILTDIKLGRFDYTLKSYQFHAVKDSKSKIQNLVPENTKCDLLSLWQQFTDFKSTQLEQTTIKNNYAAIFRFTKKLPTQSLEDAVKIRDWLIRNTTKFMAYLILRNYSSCCDWAVSSKIITENPFAELKIKKPKRRSTDNDSSRAFTEAQRDIIIQAFENHSRYSHYSPLIKFLFFTGCRLGEAFALTWGDINKDCTRISITKSRNLHGILKGTKNGKKRVFPCGSGSKLQQLLLSIRPPSPNPKDLIFTTVRGKNLCSQHLNGIWQGVVKELADRGLVPYLKPYSSRHTFATLALAKNIAVIDVAYWMGDEVNTVHKYYSHPSAVKSECPDI